MKRLLRVVSQGPTTQITRADGTVMDKCQMVLREFGNEQYADRYVVEVVGSEALATYREGDVVMAVLRFGVHEYEGRTYQDIRAAELVAMDWHGEQKRTGM